MSSYEKRKLEEEIDTRVAYDTHRAKAFLEQNIFMQFITALLFLPLVFSLLKTKKLIKQWSKL